MTARHREDVDSTATDVIVLYRDGDPRLVGIFASELLAQDAAEMLDSTVLDWHHAGMEVYGRDVETNDVKWVYGPRMLVTSPDNLVDGVSE